MARTGSLLWHDLQRFEFACSAHESPLLAKAIDALRKQTEDLARAKTARIALRLLARWAVPVLVAIAVGSVFVGTLQETLGMWSFLISDGIVAVPVLALTNRIARASREELIYQVPQRVAVLVAVFLAVLGTLGPLLAATAVGDSVDWVWWVAAAVNWATVAIALWGLVRETHAVELLDSVKVEVPDDPNF